MKTKEYYYLVYVENNLFGIYTNKNYVDCLKNEYKDKKIVVKKTKDMLLILKERERFPFAIYL